MTPEKQRIAIAEACGWDYHCPRCSQGIVEHFDGEGNYAGSSGCDYCQGQPIPMPDYPNDLNAMHEAEAILRDEQVNIFQGHLNAIIARGCRVCDFSLYPIDTLWHATAAQRAEAFLKTIRKWEDSQ